MSEPIKETDVNPKDLVGITKCPLRFVPPALSIFVAPAMADGARKYTWFNWRKKKVRLSIYIEAIERHLLALKDGEDFASDSKVHHAAHIGACIAIIADAMKGGMLIDDRPTPGPAAAMLAEQAKGSADAPKEFLYEDGSGGKPDGAAGG